MIVVVGGGHVGGGGVGVGGGWVIIISKEY